MLSDFNAASGFILWETIFFLANLIKPLKKKNKQTGTFFYNLVAFCTCTSILVY